MQVKTVCKQVYEQSHGTEERKAHIIAAMRFIALVTKLAKGLTEDEFFEVRCLKRQLAHSEIEDVQSAIAQWKAYTASSYAIAQIRELKKQILAKTVTSKLVQYFSDMETVCRAFTERKQEPKWDRFVAQLLVSDQEEQLSLRHVTKETRTFLQYFIPSCLADAHQLLRTQRGYATVPTISSLHKKATTFLCAPALFSNENSRFRDMQVAVKTIDKALEQAKAPGWTFSTKTDLALFYQKNFFKVLKNDYLRLEIAALRLALFGALNPDEKQQLIHNIKYSARYVDKEYRVAEWHEYSRLIGMSCVAAIRLERSVETEERGLEICRGSIVGVPRSSGPPTFGVVTDTDGKVATILFRNGQMKELAVEELLCFSQDTLKKIAAFPEMLLVGQPVNTEYLPHLQELPDTNENLFGRVCIVRRTNGEHHFGSIEQIDAVGNRCIVTLFMREWIDGEGRKVMQKKAHYCDLKELPKTIIDSLVPPLAEDDCALIESKLLEKPSCNKLIRILESTKSVPLLESGMIPIVFASFTVDEERIEQFTECKQSYFGISGEVVFGKEIHAIFTEDKYLSDVKKKLEPLLQKNELEIPILGCATARWHQIKAQLPVEHL